MNKQEILNILHNRHLSQHWRIAIGRVKQIPATDYRTFAGMARYIRNCDKLGIALDASAFTEMADDAKQGNYVWQVVNQDEIRLQTQRAGEKGGRYKYSRG